MKFLTFAEIKSKTSLKNQIAKGNIKIYECNTNHDMVYRFVENTNNILNLWYGFHFPKMHNKDTTEAYGWLGTSYQYKFSK